MKRKRLNFRFPYVNTPSLWGQTILTFGVLFLCSFGLYAQNGNTVSGTVSDENGDPLIGVTISVDDGVTGTTTDFDGKYSLELPDGAEELTFSYVGYSSQTIEIGDQTTIDVTMGIDAVGLEEVVVVGYGTVKKKDLTGAVSQINAEKLETEATANMSDMLRGSVPGLNVGFSMGPKGLSSASSFQIRGATNVRGAAANAPLIVLDGMIYQGDLADINPMDIATVDVLKDASSAAVYGSRASNGVILITTKRGKIGKPTITFNSSVGMVRLSGVEIDPLGPQGFIDWRTAGFESAQRNHIDNPGYYDDPSTLPSGVSVDDWKAYDGSSANDDLTAIWLNRLGFSTREIENYKQGNTENWKDRIYQTGLRNDHSVSVSGASDFIQYYWSFGYVNNDGHVYNDKWSSFRSRLNLEANITDFLKVGTNLQFASKDESPIASSTNLDINTPYSSYYEDDGVTIAAAPTGNTSISRHPHLGLAYTDRLYKRNAFNSNIYATLELPLGITFTSQYIPRVEWDKQYVHRSGDHPFENDDGQVRRYYHDSYEWQINNILKWNKEYGAHRFDVTLLQNAEKYQRWRTDTERDQFLPSDVLGFHNIQSATNNVNITSDDIYETGNAYMARLNYTFNDRYMVTGSWRRDGYSAFGQQHPTADFGSVALGWILSEEDFFKVDAIDLLKLRVSYGTNGNRELGDLGIYAALSNLATGNYVQVVNGSPQYVSQLYSTRLANNDLKWEKTTAFNIGVDYALFNGRINGSLEGYKMNTTDLLIARSLPDVTGFNSVTTNLGQVDNFGIELTANTVNIDNDNFGWNTEFSIAHNRNKIVHLYGDMEDVLDENGNVIGQKESDDVANGWFIDRALDEIWNYNVLGIWQENEREEAERYSRSPGDFKLEDRNGDGVYTNEDKIFQGYEDPRLRITFRNDFSYQNWGLSFKIYSYLGHKRANNHKKNDDVFYDREAALQVPYWTPENPNNEWARVESLSSGFSVYEYNSFARLDNVALSYNIPRDLLNRFKVNSMRLSFVVQNPAVWAPDWSWMDPEAAIDSNVPDITPTFYTFKLNLSL